MRSSVSLSLSYLRPIFLKNHMIHIWKDACFLFLFLDRWQIHKWDQVINNLKRKKRWEDKMLPGFLWVSYILASSSQRLWLLQLNNRQDLSLLAHLTAKDKSVATLKYLMLFQGGFLKVRSINLDFGTRVRGKPVYSTERGDQGAPGTISS